MLQKFDERNRDIRYWVNGELYHRDQPAISPFDSAVQGGDAVWEGLRVYQGRIFRLSAHLARLRASAMALAFDAIPDDATILAAIRETLIANEMRDGVHIRLTLTRGVKLTSGMDPRLNRAGCTLIVLAEHKAPVYERSGLSLITASMRRPTPDVLDPNIHHANLLNSILAKLEATAAGADDALMLDVAGNIAETNATHVFIVRDGRVLTSTTRACPVGITRATVLELCARTGIPHEVGELSLDDVYAADEMFCTGTMGELAAVTRVDGRTIGEGQPGPMTTRLSELFRAEVEASAEQVV